jgi:perosamine synthetase
MLSREGQDIFTFWKGRVALYAILKALDLKAGDRVLVPGYTCVVVPSAVVFLGAKPVYADVEAASYNVTQSTLEAAWRNHQGPRPRAIIVQHTYGIPVEAAPILDWAKSEGLAVIEDCAHVLSSTYRQTPCGQLGDAAFFSSQWNKPFTTGLGGWAVATSPVLAQRLRQVRSNFARPGLAEVGQLALQFYAHRLLFRPQLYWVLMTLYRFLGQRGLAISSSGSEELALKRPKRYAKRMSSLQEGLLRQALGQAANNMAHRQTLARIYARGLSQAGFEIPRLPADSSAIYVRYPVRVSNKFEKLLSAQKNQIELGDWFVSPLHPLLEGWERLGYRRGSCAVAEELCRTVINLPTHPRVSVMEAEKILSALLNN